ncbi:copine-8-like [Oppia nitens]|uniref:copine-8-like n=1 Tax=Oppia nitens TaxID=1686743 RepID=UPI0023DB705B|nr:copine-8-like [Oppia nitens]
MLTTTGANNNNNNNNTPGVVGNRFIETGRTEVIRNSRSPDWTVKVPVDYRFNELQVLRFEVWDYDICADNELLGRLDLDLGQLITARDDVIKKRLRLPSVQPTVHQLSSNSSSSSSGSNNNNNNNNNNELQAYSKLMVTGELWITIYEVLASKQTVQMKFEAKTLPQKDFLGSSDPYMIITKESPDGQHQLEVYRSETIHKTLAPVWSEFTVRVHDLCDCDHYRRLRISVYDWDRHTSDDFIGAVNTSLNELNKQFITGGLSVLELRRHPNLNSNNKSPKGQKKGGQSSAASATDKSSKRKSLLLKSLHKLQSLDIHNNHNNNNDNNCGLLLISKLHYRQVPTFVDYIGSGGTQLHFMAAIDCTSDSQPFHHRLLHTSAAATSSATAATTATDNKLTVVDQSVNCFEFLLNSFGQLLQPYDYQGLFAVFGFGARFAGQPTVSHAFNLRLGVGGGQQSVVPYCDSVDDMRRCYRASLKSMIPSSSSNSANTGRPFAPVINHVVQLTKNFQNGRHYFVFTILTSGCHTDTADTLEAIVRASAMPVSIVIVGVGNCPFNHLKRLSGDSTCSRGCRTYRDNVQFFQLKNYQTSTHILESRLTNTILQTIPKQMLEYMESRNFVPKNTSLV